MVLIRSIKWDKRNQQTDGTNKKDKPQKNQENKHVPPETAPATPPDTTHGVQQNGTLKVMKKYYWTSHGEGSYPAAD